MKRKPRPINGYLKLCNLTYANPPVVENGQLLLLLLLMLLLLLLLLLLLFLWTSASHLHPSVTNTKTPQIRNLLILSIYVYTDERSKRKNKEPKRRNNVYYIIWKVVEGRRVSSKLQFLFFILASRSRILVVQDRR